MDNRPLTLSITSGTVIKTVCILALAWLIFVLRDVVLIVFTAIVLSSAAEPGVRGIIRYNVPRVVAVFMLYAAFFIAFFLLFYFFFPSILKDIGAFASSLPSYLSTLANSGALSAYTSILGFPALTEISSSNILDAFRHLFNLGSGTDPLGTVGKIFGGLVSFVLIVVFSFYFAVVETGVDDFLRIVTPRKHQAYVQDLWKRSQHKIGLWMQGQLILGVIIGVLVYLGLMIIGVPHALMLAVIAGVFEIIPVFGPILAAIPAVAIAFVAGGPTLGLLTVALYLITQQFENHLIYPQVVTRVVGVPPLLVILALIIGAQLAGLLGVILSVPVAATLQELVSDMQSGRFAEQEAKPE